jgi:hypothetical protein
VATHNTIRAHIAAAGGVNVSQTIPSLASTRNTAAYENALSILNTIISDSFSRIVRSIY